MRTRPWIVNPSTIGHSLAPADGRRGAGAQTTLDMDDSGATKPAFAPGEIPVDDGAADDRSQLTKLSLGQMGVRPEMSMAKEKIATIDGKEQKITAGETIHQATIFGQLTGLTGPKELPNAKPGQDSITYGLVGRIEGVNVLTGEMFKAAILYLPAGFHDMFLGEIELQLKGGDGNVAIAFALEFHSIPASNPRGYSWKAINKLPMEKVDPLARLRQRALAGTTIKGLTSPTAGRTIAAT